MLSLFDQVLKEVKIFEDIRVEIVILNLVHKVDGKVRDEIHILDYVGIEHFTFEHKSSCHINEVNKD